MIDELPKEINQTEIGILLAAAILRSGGMGLHQAAREAAVLETLIRLDAQEEASDECPF